MEWNFGNLTAKSAGIYNVLKVCAGTGEKSVQDFRHEIAAYFGDGIYHELGGYMNCIDVSGVSEDYRSPIVSFFALLDEHSVMKTGVRGLSEPQAELFKEDDRVLVLSDDYLADAPLLAECFQGLARSETKA
jgi:hypothetical protein